MRGKQTSVGEAKVVVVAHLATGVSQRSDCETTSQLAGMKEYVVKDNSVSFTSEQLVKQLLPCSSSCQSQE
jgi:ribosomal protein L30E